MIPFRLTFEPGVPAYEQALYAMKKALIAGQLKPGEPFPSVRALSKAFKINPNTAHKAVAQLVAEGLLEVRPGIGTVVAAPPAASRAERGRLVAREVERLTMEAMRLGMPLEELLETIAEQWRKLERKDVR
ncbi:MAG: GntR family transcriptional regulator [Acidobacteria bacterium]|nr:GntR family transcriptional regulator [Acidobacteriota bacterium]